MSTRAYIKSYQLDMPYEVRSQHTLVSGVNCLIKYMQYISYMSGKKSFISSLITLLRFM